MPAPRNNRNAAGNKGGGRKTDYHPSYCIQAEKLAKLGLIDKELADFFEVSEQTINTWKKKHIVFSLALKKGKLIADAEVADRLFKRATGYDAPDVDIKVIKGKIVKTKLTKHYPPDPTSMIFFLKNRQKEKWKDRHDVSAKVDWLKVLDNMSEEDLQRLATEMLRQQAG